MTHDARLDRELDLWWDAEVLGDPHPPSTVPLEGEIETIRDLHESDAPAAPTPAFATLLKVDLMMTAREMQGSAPSRAVPPYVKRVKTSAPPIPRPAFVPAAHWPKRAVAQVAIVAALLLGMIGAIYGGGYLNRSSKSPTAIPAVLGANAASTPAATAATANYRGDAARTGVMPGPAPVGVPKMVWQQLLPGVTETPLYAEGRLFVTRGQQGELGARLYALDVKTGETRWRASVTSEQGAVPSLDSQYVYVLTSHQTLVALRQDTGEVVWTYVTGGTARSVAPAVADGIVFVKTDDGSVLAVDATTGQERWRSPVPATSVNQSANEVTILSTVAIAVSDGVVYAAGEGGVLYAFSAETGTQRWTAQTNGNVIAAAAVADGTAYLIAQEVGPNPNPVVSTLYALKATDGTERWRIDDVDPGVALAVGNSAVYVSGSVHGLNEPANSLAAFDVKDGRKLWTAGLYQAGAPVLVEGTVYVTAGGAGGGVGAGNSDIYAVNAANGSVLWKTAIGPTAAPLIVDGLVIVPMVGYVFALGDNGSLATPAPGTEINVFNPQCSPPQSRGPAELPAGTPAATIIQGRSQVVNGLPEILLDELPKGAAADAETVSKVEETLAEMASCVARGGNSATLSLAGFATDDYLRRADVQARSAAAGFPSVQPIFGRDNNPVTQIETTVVLPDGRVGVAFMQTSSTGWFVVFAEQDGHWLIDEYYEIVTMLGGHG